MQICCRVQSLVLVLYYQEGRGEFEIWQECLVSGMSLKDVFIKILMCDTLWKLMTVEM